MNWIRLSSEYFRHRKTLRLVRMFGKEAALYPLRLWLWAVEQSPRGDLRDIEPEELAMICEHDGGPEDLWAGLTACGFIENADGGWRIRSWDEHQGKLIERNERNRERMQRARSANVQRTCEATDETDERDETNETKEAAPEIPANLGTPAFRAAWEEWQAYRRERKLSPWKPVTIRKAFKEWSAWGPERTIAAIERSIRNGYQGVFEDHAGKKQADNLAWLRAGGHRDEPADPGPSVEERLAALADSIPDTIYGADSLRARIVALSGSPAEVESRLQEIEADALAVSRPTLPPAELKEIERACAKLPKESAPEVRESLIRKRLRALAGIPQLSLFTVVVPERRKSA